VELCTTHWEETGIKQPAFVDALTYNHTPCDNPYLPDIVEVAVRNRFLRPQFLHLI